MRKIKFRVWNTKTLSWLHPCQIAVGGEGVLWDESKCTGSEVLHECELMQYTGVNTLDGTEIYEGDIISDPDKIYAGGRVEFCCGAFGVFLDYDNIFAPFSEFTREAIERVEIIGNAYEQPELLQPPQ